MRRSGLSPQTAGGVRLTPLPAEEVRVPTAWWTVERGLYALLVLGAALIRWLWLSTRPLTPEEAHHAWLAWHNTQPFPHLPVVHVHPLLYALQWMTFLLSGGSDGLARFWPSLAGILLVLLPYGLRGILGRRRALLIALWLAFSPQLVYWSRHASGTILGVFGILFLLVALIRWLERGGYLQDEEGPSPAELQEFRRGLVIVAVALALTLTSTEGVYTALIGLLIGLWPQRHTLLRAWRRAGGEGHHKAAAVFLLLVTSVGTVFFTDFSAMGNVADLAGQWMASLWRNQGYPWFWVPFRLAADEPLLTVLAVWGAWRAIQRRTAWDRLWVYWALFSLLWGFRAGRSSADVAFLLLPLSFLAGEALEHLLDFLESPSPTWREELVLIGAFFVIEGFWFMMFAGYVETLTTQYIPALVVVPILLFLLLILYGWWLGWRASWRVVGVSLLITGWLWTWMALWVQNLHLAPDAALNAMPGIERTTTHWNVRLMIRALERISAERQTDLHEIPLDVIFPRDGDVLRWYLREFKNVREIYGAKGATAEVVIAPVTTGEIPGYTGMDWIVTVTQLPTQLGGRIYHWWLYREASLPDERQEVILWYRASTRP